ncbi:MAG: Putative pre-16S rRNA nuclease [Holosporales bacterium]
MIIDISHIKKEIGKRVLGLDVGEKTIGLALSDTLWTIATPKTTLKRQYPIQKDLDALIKLIHDESVSTIVVGFPLNMNGTQGPSCQRVLDLCTHFEHIPIVLWDERLSTVAVERTMLSADISRKKRAQHVDKLAASFILQGALDRFNFQANPGHSFT